MAEITSKLLNNNYTLPQHNQYSDLAMGWTVWGSHLGNCSLFSLFYNSSNQHLHQPSLLFKGYHILLLGGKVSGA